MGQTHPKINQINKATLNQYLPKIKNQEDIEAAIKALIALMTLPEKLGQLQQTDYGSSTISEAIRTKIINGQIGSFLGPTNVNVINEMQRLSMENSRLKIPLLIGRDVIHGFRTVMPIPLGQAASFNTDLVQQAARCAALEASSCGIKWTFSPMVDIARDPRWGRIAEGCGQDPYLVSKIGSAMVKGYQTNNLKDQTAIIACGKHYVGYGAAEGGRDYNTTLIPQNTLRDIYLTPFKALADSGIQSYMSAFNDLNGVPTSGNQFTLKQVLRKQWGFDGLVVSDYNAITEMITHGFCQNQKQAALKGFNGGVDMEMVSTAFWNNLSALITEGKVSIADIDIAVAHCLRVKFRLGLFQNPYTDPARQSIILDPKNLAVAKNLAAQSAVLLQNNKNTLPMKNTISTLAIIGPLADDGNNQLGCWVPDGRGSDSITPLTSFKQALKSTKITYAKGIKDCRSTDTSLFQEAINAAKNSEIVVMFLGEDNDLSGESHSRAFINLPGVQEQLISQISKTGKPIILVIYAGRSLLLNKITSLVDSILYTWHLGTMAGPAIVDLILGNTIPSGKLPLTFLRQVGQIPLYYNKKNTGRPNNTHNYIPYTSSYVDIDSTPLYPFGYGLSYATFTYSDIKLSKTVMNFGQSLLVSVVVKNQSNFPADEVVLMFVRDLFGSYTRPVKQLKGFRRVSFKANQSQTVIFVISSDDLRFWTKNQIFSAEAGKFTVWVGKNSEDETLSATFELTGTNQEEFDII